MNLNGHRFTGAIPVELVDLAKLRVLRLTGSYNPVQGDGGVGLNGRILPELGKLSHLEELILGGNRLTGPIPPELGNLANLRRLNLHGDHYPFRGEAHLGLEGPIPPEFAKLERLEYLVLAQNQLSGPIPPQLGDLTDLEELHLDLNKLSGSVPSELGRLAKLTQLRLADNRVEGPLPETFGGLARLEVLLIGRTRMSGPLPATATGMTALRTLSMGQTRLCVPRDSAFDAWVAGIMWFSGNRCRPDADSVTEARPDHRRRRWPVCAAPLLAPVLFSGLFFFPAGCTLPAARSRLDHRLARNWRAAGRVPFRSSAGAPAGTESGVAA